MDYDGDLFTSPVFYGRYTLDGAFIRFTPRAVTCTQSDEDCPVTFQATIRPDHRLSLAGTGDSGKDPKPCGSCGAC